MLKKKRRRGRPSREETLIHKIEEAVLSMNERAAEVIPEMFQILEDIARDETATHASRSQSAKYIIQRAEDYLKEETKEQEDDQSEEEDFSRPLISTSFSSESKSH